MNDSHDNAAADKAILLQVLGDGVRMNQTAQDARDRLLQARIGSVANASDDFLVALVNELASWKDEILRELAVRVAREAEETESGGGTDDYYCPDEQDFDEGSL